MLDRIRRVLFGGPEAGSNSKQKQEGSGGTMFKDIQSVDEIINASRDHRVLIYKHSTACPISWRSQRELESYLENNPGSDAYMVVVQQQRKISNEIEEKLGIEHQTPQLLVLDDGEVVNHWSHHEITQETISKTLS